MRVTQILCSKNGAQRGGVAHFETAAASLETIDDTTPQLADDTFARAAPPETRDFLDTNESVPRPL